MNYEPVWAENLEGDKHKTHAQSQATNDGTTDLPPPKNKLQNVYTLEN